MPIATVPIYQAQENVGGVAEESTRETFGDTLIDQAGQGRGCIMAKGYWIAHVTVTDAQLYENFKAANAEAFAKYGGRFLVRGGGFECMSGRARDRHLVIEFDSYQVALDRYASSR